MRSETRGDEAAHDRADTALLGVRTRFQCGALRVGDGDRQGDDGAPAGLGAGAAFGRGAPVVREGHTIFLASQMHVIHARWAATQENLALPPPSTGAAHNVGGVERGSRT